MGEVQRLLRRSNLPSSSASHLFEKGLAGRVCLTKFQWLVGLFFFRVDLRCNAVRLSMKDYSSMPPWCGRDWSENRILDGGDVCWDASQMECTTRVSQPSMVTLRAVALHLTVRGGESFFSPQSCETQEGGRPEDAVRATSRQHEKVHTRTPLHHALNRSAVLGWGCSRNDRCRGRRSCEGQRQAPAVHPSTHCKLRRKPPSFLRCSSWLWTTHFPSYFSAMLGSTVDTRFALAWTLFLGPLSGSHLFGVCRAWGVREHVDFLGDHFTICSRIRRIASSTVVTCNASVLGGGLDECRWTSDPEVDSGFGQHSSCPSYPAVTCRWLFRLRSTRNLLRLGDDFRICFRIQLFFWFDSGCMFPQIRGAIGRIYVKEEPPTLKSILAQSQCAQSMLRLFAETVARVGVWGWGGREVGSLMEFGRARNIWISQGDVLGPLVGANTSTSQKKRKGETHKITQNMSKIHNVFLFLSFFFRRHTWRTYDLNVLANFQRQFGKSFRIPPRTGTSATRANTPPVASGASRCITSHSTEGWNYTKPSRHSHKGSQQRNTGERQKEDWTQTCRSTQQPKGDQTWEFSSQSSARNVRHLWRTSWRVENEYRWIQETLEVVGITGTRKMMVMRHRGRAVHFCWV